MSLKAMTRTMNNKRLLIKPRLEEFLYTHPNLYFSPEVADLLRAQLVAKPRDRSNSFSASGAGGCHRKQVLAYLGARQDGAVSAQLAHIFVHGNFVHLELQGLCLEAGIMDTMEVPLTWKKMRTKGTMDGVGSIPDDHPLRSHDAEFIIEFKGINSWTYGATVKNDTPDIAYKRQIARYMLVSGINVASVFYLNKDNLSSHEWVYTSDDLKVYIVEARKELVALNESVDNKKLPPPLKGAAQGIPAECQSCPFSGAGGVCLNTGDWWTP